jgi:circadian clock protein KaiB
VSSYSFSLYIAGQTQRSQVAEANLRALCESRLPGAYDLQVIDALEMPHIAEEKRILATPTVVRQLPLPERRVVGDLSDSRKAGEALGLPDKSIALGEAGND